ncbi:MAG: hypothetical protein ACI9FW_001026, partial [Flavobacterium sp.]
SFIRRLNTVYHSDEVRIALYLQKTLTNVGVFF